MVTNPRTLLDRVLTMMGKSDFADLGLSKLLVSALSDTDVSEMIRHQIYFLLLYSPSSTANITENILPHSSITSIDVNTIRTWTPEERCAIVLHEIGHILRNDPSLVLNSSSSFTREFLADNFAIEKGFGNAIITGLRRGIQFNPGEFNKESTHERIRGSCNKTTQYMSPYDGELTP